MSAQSLLDARALVAVAAYRVRHGHGPSWAWLCDRLDVSRAELDRTMHDLRRRGAVTLTAEPGSLDVDRAAALAAVAIVRDDAARTRNALPRYIPPRRRRREEADSE